MSALEQDVPEPVPRAQSHRDPAGDHVVAQPRSHAASRADLGRLAAAVRTVQHQEESRVGMGTHGLPSQPLQPGVGFREYLADLGVVEQLA